MGGSSEVGPRRAKYLRDYYLRNRDNLHRYLRGKRAEKRAKLAEIKAAAGCKRCGERDPACLQFHHRDPKEKFQTISRMYAGAWGWDKMQREIDKCDVLCANCHHKEHRAIDNERRKK